MSELEHRSALPVAQLPGRSTIRECKDSSNLTHRLEEAQSVNPIANQDSCLTGQEQPFRPTDALKKIRGFGPRPLPGDLLRI